MNALEVIEGIITNDFDSLLYGGRVIIERYSLILSQDLSM